MINEIRNSAGFANFTATKKLKPRAPYSSSFQPLKAEVEAVGKADMIEPYSVEQSLRAFDDDDNHSASSELENLEEVSEDLATLDGDDTAFDEPAEQSQIYANTGSLADSEVSEIEPTSDEQLDDKAIVDTVINNISDKIDASFRALESDVINQIEAHLGKTLLDVYKQQLAQETTEKLKQTVSQILSERADAKVNISGPDELIGLFKSQLGDENSDDPKLVFSTDPTSTDLTVQIDEISISSRFGELDTLVSELFE